MTREGRKNPDRRSGLSSLEQSPLWQDLISIVFTFWMLWWGIEDWHKGALPKLLVVMCVVMGPGQVLRFTRRLSRYRNR